EPGSLNEEDADEVSDDLPNNSSALLIAFENVWATRVVSALSDADAILIDSIRIPAEVVAQAREAGSPPTPKEKETRWDFFAWQPERPSLPAPPPPCPAASPTGRTRSGTGKSRTTTSSRRRRRRASSM